MFMRQSRIFRTDIAIYSTKNERQQSKNEVELLRQILIKILTIKFYDSLCIYVYSTKHFFSYQLEIAFSYLCINTICKVYETIKNIWNNQSNLLNLK